MGQYFLGIQYITLPICIASLQVWSRVRRVKCDQYWPGRGTETYGVMCVTLTDTQELATYVIRTFQLQRVSSAHVRSLNPACYTIRPAHCYTGRGGGGTLKSKKRVETTRELSSAHILDFTKHFKYARLF